MPAIRELLLNAIIHRDYRDPTDVIIKIFDDCITFTNPGKFMRGLTAQALMTDDYVAVHRNKLLAEAFYLHGDIEKYGTEFIRIREQLREYSRVRAEIKQGGDFMQASMRETATPQVTPQVVAMLKAMRADHSREQLQKAWMLTPFAQCQTIICTAG